MRFRLLIRSCAVAAFVLGIVLLSGCTTNTKKDSHTQEIERLKAENAALRRKIRLLSQNQPPNSKRRQSIYRNRAQTVHFGNRPVLGKSGATIALIEFSDYFCPYCRRFHVTTFERLKKNYIDKGKLLYVYRDYPRAMAKKAVTAAIAANCAGDQGAYWKMQKMLYRKSPAINDIFYTAAAAKIGLDITQYEACRRSDQQRKAVHADYVYGNTLGIRGTPTFYIGRVKNNRIVAVRKIVGAQPYIKFSQEIERLLKARQLP